MLGLLARCARCSSLRRSSRFVRSNCPLIASLARVRCSVPAASAAAGRGLTTAAALLLAFVTLALFATVTELQRDGAGRLFLASGGGGAVAGPVTAALPARSDSSLCSSLVLSLAGSRPCRWPVCAGGVEFFRRERLLWRNRCQGHRMMIPLLLARLLLYRPTADACCTRSAAQRAAQGPRLCRHRSLVEVGEPCFSQRHRLTASLTICR